jgi:peptidoglycan/LPS O-acetylase OafA/YrhL
MGAAEDGPMIYRSDIDGLRALAVVPVVLFHMNAHSVTGGFVGVDVFFVISGLLICGMIDKDIGRGTFSIADFYKRRALRILPALIAMMIGASLLACIYSLPVELKEYASSLASAVASISNGYFAATAGYFDAPAETKPLLHTWSLSVEEQFYVFTPIFMMLAYRFFPKHMKAVFVAATVLSFVAALAMNARNATFAFYLTPFRAWELALGALLAIGAIPTPRSRMVREICGGAGLVLLLSTYQFGSPTTPLPLISSLACIGAVLIIASSGNGLSLTGRLLSWRPIVFVGLISYSLYLWHWPLIVFQKTDSVFIRGASDAAVTATLIALMLLMAFLSWRFVERPFRTMAKISSNRSVLASSGAAVGGVLAMCLVLIASGGATFRFPDHVVALGSYLAYDPAPSFRTGTCYLATNRQTFDVDSCIKMDLARPNYLLVGDSHAAHLWSGLAGAMPDVNLMQASASTCRPVLQETLALDRRACPRLMNYVFDTFLRANKVDRVLLSASWKDEDLAPLARTLDALRARGVDVTLLGPIVEYDGALPRLLANQILRGDPTIARNDRTAGVRARDRAMYRLATEKGVKYVSVYDAVCPNDRCTETVDGDIPIQFDAGHLTAQGSLEVGKRLAASLLGTRELSSAEPRSSL